LEFCLLSPNTPSRPKDRSTPFALARRRLHRTNSNAKANKKTNPTTPPTTPPAILGVLFSPLGEPALVVVDVGVDVAEPMGDNIVASGDKVVVADEVNALVVDSVLERWVDVEALPDDVLDEPELESGAEVDIEFEPEPVKVLDVEPATGGAKGAAAGGTDESASADADGTPFAALCVVDDWEVSDFEEDVPEFCKGAWGAGMLAVAAMPEGFARGALVSTGEGRAPVITEGALAGTVMTPKFGTVTTAGRVETVNSPRVFVPLSIKRS